MRYYKLTINQGYNANSKTANTLGSVCSLVLDENHPFAPRITFNVTAVADCTSYIPTLITLYNLPAYFYSATQQLIGCEVILEAGIKESNLSIKAGIKPSSSFIIFWGSIQAVIPDYTGKDVNITLYCGAVNPNDMTDSAIETKIPRKGGNVADKIAAHLRSVFNNNVSIEISEDARAVTNQENCDIMLRTDPRGYKVTYSNTQYINTQSISDVLTSVNEKAKIFGLTIQVDGKWLTITTLSGGKNTAGVYSPNAQNFLAQPNYATIASVNCSFSMDADIRVAKTLSIPNNIALGSEPITGDINSAAAAGYTAKSIIGGNFTITKVWHKGDSRGTNAESWATEVEAVTTKTLARGAV